MTRSAPRTTASKTTPSKATPSRSTPPKGAPATTGAATSTPPEDLETGPVTAPVTADAPSAAAPADEAAPPLPLVDSPADGVPQVIDDERALVRAARELALGTGPVAVDAERASGYRYGQRAYLVQLRREGAGTFLIDPVACPDLSPIAQGLHGVEWILHAATQDLPCLAEVGMRPDALFDTELGARLAGLPRVGLSAVLEHYVGVRLAKEHSAVDWSTRPLPEPWLRYAALDVELLAAVRDAMEADLRAQGKLDWARQEFDHLLSFTGPAARIDPWRRTSGIHRVRGRRSIAVARELWLTRDDIARSRDISPGRVLPDATMLELAQAAPAGTRDLARLSRHKGVSRHGAAWLEAIRRAQGLPDSELPPTTLPSDAPPPIRVWAEREPVAAARFAQVREELTRFSQEHEVPVENLLTPDILRRLLWDPPPVEDVEEHLRSRGARPWQIEIVGPRIRAAMADHPGSEGVDGS